MRILVTGSSGLIGTALLAQLAKDGHLVVRLTRSNSSVMGRHIPWDPEAGVVDCDDLEDFDAMVHLAGETIMGRWTPEKKARIHDSRVKSTRVLSESVAKLRSRPKVLVSASAIGYYGNRSDELLNEQSAAGSLFLSGVSKAWEDATQPARECTRVVNLRIGFVLSAQGGGLASMLTPFKWGLGGRVGNGRQYLSWIAIDDVVGAIAHAIRTEALAGPVNAVAPNCVTNREFAKTLGSVLKRPTLFPLPSFLARLMFGEMADNLLLASARVEPARLLTSGYQFRLPQLQPALRQALGK